VRLTVIGCAGSFPSPQSPASCYLLEHDGVAIALDLGNGALGPLQARSDIRSLEAVVLSHLHADHCLDLTSMYVARKYHPEGPPLVPLAVHGPSGTGQRIADAYRTTRAERVAGLEQVLRFVDHTPLAIRIGPFAVSVARVAHPVEAYAIRVEAGGTALVYSGDTGPCDALVDLSRGADLALFEASFLTGPNNPRDLHLTAAEAGEHAARAGVPRLVLTHLVTWNDQQASQSEARATYDGELLLAAPGMVVEL
jgi:ribonuclease BN (tRNA processing enzyme)